MPNVRIGKINAELQKNIYDILSKKVKDPRLTEMFTVTGVSADKELTVAKVFISIFSKDSVKADETFAAIVNSTNFVRSSLFKMMRIKNVPQITFYKDEVSDYGQHIDKLIDQLNFDKDK